MQLLSLINDQSGNYSKSFFRDMAFHPLFDLHDHITANFKQ